MLCLDEACEKCLSLVGKTLKKTMVVIIAQIVNHQSTLFSVIRIGFWEIIYDILWVIRVVVQFFTNCSVAITLEGLPKILHTPKNFYLHISTFWNNGVNFYLALESTFTLAYNSFIRMTKTI